MSSRDDGALSRRRPSRRQPHRNCKRIRYENCRAPVLLDIPDPILVHLLGFTMLQEKEFETNIWKWLAELRRVCRVFRNLIPQLVPDKFSVNEYELGTRTHMLGALLRSLRDTSWKTANLEEFSFDSSAGNSQIHRTLRSFIMKPGALPNLKRLDLCAIPATDQATNRRVVFNANFLHALARNLPHLAHLHLGGLYLEDLTPAHFSIFSALLQQPLQTLQFSCCGVSVAVLNAFLPRHGSSLVDLALSYTSIGWPPNEPGSRLITEHCSQLQDLSLACSGITSRGLESILQANNGIRKLDVSFCDALGPECIDVLIRHAPNLEKLYVYTVVWFTDAGLDRLVQGQIDHWIRADTGEIPLCYVGVERPDVTQAGIDRVMSKPHIGSLRIVY